MSDRSLKIIITAGGTGGHIFPAIAVANAIKIILPKADILFVGAKGRMEMEKVPQAGYRIEGLNISGIQRKITLKNISVPFKLMASLIKANRILNNFKPDIVAGFGGYASGPVMRRATAKGIPTLIQEQNSFPGITNRILAKKVNKICVAYDGMDRFFPYEKIVLTGNPVRQDIIHTEHLKNDAAKHFNINPEKFTLLAIGGSLGARTINESIAGLLPWLEKQQLQIIWQTGKHYFQEAERISHDLNYAGIQASAFITRMDLAYAASDIIISRAGAIAISEICLVKKPAILIPSPNVSEDHQTKNAMALVKQNAALLVKDIDAREKLKDELEKLIANSSQQNDLINNISKLGKADAAERIANTIIELTDTKSKHK